MVWTDKHTQCCHMSRNMISHHQRSLARQSPHLSPIVPTFIFSVVFHDKCSVHHSPYRRELVSLSLWASLRSLATMIINVGRLPMNGKRLSWLFTCAVFHTFSGFWCFRIQSRLTSCLSFNILLAILVLSLLFSQGGHRQHVHS